MDDHQHQLTLPDLRDYVRLPNAPKYDIIRLDPKEIIIKGQDDPDAERMLTVAASEIKANLSTNKVAQGVQAEAKKMVNSIQLLGLQSLPLVRPDKEHEG